MTSSKKHLSYEHILQIRETGNLISFMAEREINELSYKAIQEQAQFFRDRLGISLEESGVTVARLAEIRAARNLLLHSAGVINSLYLEIVPHSLQKLGEQINLSIEHVQLAGKDLSTYASFLHSTLTEKFCHSS
jgi:hypothetical protein